MRGNGYFKGADVVLSCRFTDKQYKSCMRAANGKRTYIFGQHCVNYHSFLCSVSLIFVSRFSFLSPAQSSTVSIPVSRLYDLAICISPAPCLYNLRISIVHRSLPPTSSHHQDVLPCGGFGDMLAWLEADLKQAASERAIRPWILVAGHHPMYHVRFLAIPACIRCPHSLALCG